MSETAEPSATYQALMSVKPADLSLNQWAQRAGMNRSIFNGIRAHGNPTMQTIDRLLAAIGVDAGAFRSRLDGPVRTEVAGTGMVDEAQVHRARGQRSSNRAPIPLVGSAVGGTFVDLDEHVELTELHLSEVLDYLARPESLEGDPGAYAVTIVGDSMSPRFKPRERAIVSPRASLGIGDDVLVQLRGKGTDQEADRVTMVLIKELVKLGSTFVDLRQYNPEMTFRIGRDRVASIHRVTTRL